jgi:phosphate/sulfate permease
VNTALLILFLVVAAALAFDYINGFHDAANSIATVVSTRVLSPRYAVAWAAFFNFIAFLVFHLTVAATMGKGIIDPVIADNRLIAATLSAACFWDVLTWYWGLPTSSSHALIGGMIGAALVKTGWSALEWAGIGKTVLFIFVAPLVGMVTGLVIAVIVAWLFRNATPRQVDKTFRRGQLFSAAFYSLGHGGNDAQKTMGIIFVLLLAATQANRNLTWQEHFALTDHAFNTLQKGPEQLPADVVKQLRTLKDRTFDWDTNKDKTYDTVRGFEAALAEVLSQAELQQYGRRIMQAADQAQVPTEVVLACHVAMGLGTLFGGWRIVKTMGQRIIKLRPVDGFCAEAGAATTLVMTIFGGIPVSTTHTITGAIVGVGSTKRLSAVRWGVAERVVWAWILTIPGCALVAAICWWLLWWLR